MLSLSLSVSVVTVTTDARPVIRNLYLCGHMVTLALKVVMEKDRDFMEINLLHRRVKLMWHEVRLVMDFKLVEEIPRRVR